MSEPMALQKAKVWLVTGYPFFATLLLRRPMTLTDRVPTLAVDVKGRIYVNPDFVQTLSVEQVIFGLTHEIMHLLLLHALRRGHRDPERWNLACDAVINDTLRDARVGEWIPNIVDVPGGRHKSAEELYGQLPAADGGQGSGQLGDDPLARDIIPGDGHADPQNPRPLSEAELSEAEMEIKQAVFQAAHVAEMRGNLPGALSVLVQNILAVKTPWYDILERFMLERADTAYSWQRPNRRFVAQGVYLPSINSQAAMGEMVLAIDTSGSVSEQELGHFAGHLNRIMETCKPATLHVIYCDARVVRVDTISRDDLPVKLAVTGGGGTAFAPVFRHVERHAITPACLVYLTDGNGDQRRLNDPGYPVVWLTTQAEEGFRFGEVIKFDMEN